MQPLALPPLRAPFTDQRGLLTPPAAAFVRGVYERTGGAAGERSVEHKTWIPEFDGIAVVGRVEFSAQAVRVERTVLWRAQVRPIGESTSANSGAALLVNLPWEARPGAFCTVSDFVVASYGHRRVVGKVAALAPWSATPSTIVVSGMYEVSE